MSGVAAGGAAFPRPFSHVGDVPFHPQSGMTLRQWYAGQIAAAAMTNATGLGEWSKEQRGSAFSKLANISYELADAMIAEDSK